MLRGRRMYRIPNCATWIRRIAAQVYFTVNCDIAKSHEFLDLTDDAKNWFVESAPANQQAAKRLEVQACVNQTRGRSIVDLLAYRQGLGTSPGEEAMVEETLSSLARNPDWSGGFAAVQLKPERIQNRQF
jgi:hypothetical protein